MIESGLNVIIIVNMNTEMRIGEWVEKKKSNLYLFNYFISLSIYLFFIYYQH